MSALVTLVLLVSVFGNGVSTKSPVTPSGHNLVDSTVQENRHSNDSYMEELPVRERLTEMHSENSSVNIESSSIRNASNPLIVNENRDKLDIEDMQDKEFPVVKFNGSKYDRKRRTFRMKQIRKILNHISKSTSSLQINNTNEQENITTGEKNTDVPKAILRNILTKYIRYKGLEDNATETNDETLKTETYDDNSTSRYENNTASNMLVNFIRLFESESPIIRKRISDYDDTDDHEENNDDDDNDDDDNDDIIKLVEKIENAEKKEDNDYDISDFIINMLGGGHNNGWNLNPDTDLESRIDIPIDGITNFNDEKHALTTDMVQNHIHSPDYVSHTEHTVTDASAGNLANGKMENLLWKDFFSFEIPDKVTKKPNSVPDGNGSKMTAITYGKPDIDSKYDYEEDDDSWESNEDYDYPEETYINYSDGYDVHTPKIAKSNTVVSQVNTKINHYPTYTSQSGSLFDHNINQRRSFHSRIEEESSEEYEDNMIGDALLPHLQKEKPKNKKITPFVGRLSLFSKDKIYSSSATDQDDDSTSNSIEREEIDRVPVQIKSLFHNKISKVHLGSQSSDSSSYSSEKVSSSSEEIDSSSSEEQFHFKRRMRKGSDSSSHSESKEYKSLSSEKSLPVRITRLLHNKKSKFSGSESSDLTSYSSEKLSSSEEVDSFSSSEEQSHHLSRTRKGSSSQSNSKESQSYSSENSLSLSDENSSSYDYSSENTKKFSDEKYQWRHMIKRRGSSGTSESISDEYSSESFSDEIFSSSDEDNLSSSSEEHVPVVKQESRFVHIHKPKNYVQPFNHYYTFFKTRDWKRLDENRYMEESRAYNRQHFEDEGNIKEVTTPIPTVKVEQLYVSKVKQDVPKRPPQPFVLLQRTAIVRTTPPPPPTPFIPVQTTTPIPPTQPPKPFIPVHTFPPPQPSTPFIPIQTTRELPPPPPPTPYIPIQVTRVTPPPPPPAPPVVNRIQILKTAVPRYQPPPPPPPRPLPKIKVVRTRFTTPKPTPPPPPPPKFRPIPRVQILRAYPSPFPRPIPNTPKPTPKPNYMQWYLPIIYNKIMNLRKVKTPKPKPVQPKKPTSYDILENEIMQIDVQKAWTNSYQNNAKKSFYTKSSYKKPGSYSTRYQKLSYKRPTYGSYGNAYSGNQPQRGYGKYGRDYSQYPFQETKNGYGYKSNGRNGYFNRPYRNAYSPKLSRFNVPYHIFSSKQHNHSNAFGQLPRHFGHSAKKDCDKNGVHGNNLHFAANKKVIPPPPGSAMNGFYPPFQKLKY